MIEIILGVAAAFLLALAASVAVEAELRISELRKRSRELAAMLSWFRRNEANLDQLLEFRRKMRGPVFIAAPRLSVHATGNTDETTPYLVARVTTKSLSNGLPK